jgi:hypothetical protein
MIVVYHETVVHAVHQTHVQVMDNVYVLQPQAVKLQEEFVAHSRELSILSLLRPD